MLLVIQNIRVEDLVLLWVWSFYFIFFFLFLFILFALFNWIHWIRTLDMFNEIGVLLFFFNSFILYQLFTNIGVKIEMKFFFFTRFISNQFNAELPSISESITVLCLCLNESFLLLLTCVHRSCFTFLFITHVKFIRIMEDNVIII